MIPFSGLISNAIKMFDVPLCVTDTIYTVSGGEDKQIIQKERTIQAAVDPSNSRKLQQIFGGNVSDGAIGIYTESVLYIDDIYTTGKRSLQSYVDYAGFTYRVTQMADWRQQTGTYVYLAERHIKQDEV